ncbi:hypothetical protein Tco_0400213 [Tanacetum coccineum]
MAPRFTMLAERRSSSIKRIDDKDVGTGMELKTKSETAIHLDTSVLTFVGQLQNRSIFDAVAGEECKRLSLRLTISALKFLPCESCGNGAHYGYNCPPKVLIISSPEPCNNQTVDELLQTLPSFDPTCYSGDGSSFTYDSTPNFVDDSPNVINPPPQPPTYSYEICGNDAHYGHDCPPQVPFIYNPEPCYNQDFNFPQNFQRRKEDKRINTSVIELKIDIGRFHLYDDDDERKVLFPLNDIIISGLPQCVAITPFYRSRGAVDLLIMVDEHL